MNIKTFEDKLCDIIENAKKIAVKIFVIEKDFFKGDKKYLNGTGFFLDQNHIVTNFHVIEDADKIKIGMYQKKQLISVEIVGFDVYYDIAILKIHDCNISLLKCNSKNLKEGQIVLSIGMPFGLDFSSSIGMISSLNHCIKLENGNVIKEVIQIDEKLLPGCSGGPLINMNSEIIGLNTLMFMEDKVSFALKIDFVMEIANKIIGK